MPHIVVENGPNKGQNVHVAEDSPLVVGRDPKCAIVLKDPLLSRKHFAVRFIKKMLVLEDLKSVNGTYLNGERLKTRSRLGDGDRIQAGETLLTYFANQALDPLIGKTISGTGMDIP